MRRARGREREGGREEKVHSLDRKRGRRKEGGREGEGEEEQQ